jgi:hypothetical protein
VAIDHLDEKNPGLFINSLNLLSKALDIFPALVEECLPGIYEKTLPVLELKKVEIGQLVNKYLQKIYEKLDKTKCCKELLKAAANTLINLKSRIEALNQIFNIFKDTDLE